MFLSKNTIMTNFSERTEDLSLILESRGGHGFNKNKDNKKEGSKLKRKETLGSGIYGKQSLKFLNFGTRENLFTDEVPEEEVKRKNSNSVLNTQPAKPVNMNYNTLTNFNNNTNYNSNYSTIPEMNSHNAGKGSIDMRMYKEGDVLKENSQERDLLERTITEELDRRDLRSNTSQRLPILELRSNSNSLQMNQAYNNIKTETDVGINMLSTEETNSPNNQLSLFNQASDSKDEQIKRNSVIFKRKAKKDSLLRNTYNYSKGFNLHREKSKAICMDNLTSEANLPHKAIHKHKVTNESNNISISKFKPLESGVDFINTNPNTSSNTNSKKKQEDIFSQEEADINNEFFSKYKGLLEKLQEMKQKMAKNNVLNQRDIEVIVESRKLSMLETLKNKYLMAKTIYVHKKQFLKLNDKPKKNQSKTIFELKDINASMYQSQNTQNNQSFYRPRPQTQHNLSIQSSHNQKSVCFQDKDSNVNKTVNTGTFHTPIQKKGLFSANAKLNNNQGKTLNVSGTENLENKSNYGARFGSSFLLDSPSKKKKQQEVRKINIQNKDLHNKLKQAIKKMDEYQIETTK